MVHRKHSTLGPNHANYHEVARHGTRTRATAAQKSRDGALTEALTRLGGEAQNPTIVAPPPSAARVQRLGQILMEAHGLTQGILQDGLARAKQLRERVADALVAMGAASQDDVLKALAVRHGLPFLAAKERLTRGRAVTRREEPGPGGAMTENGFCIIHTLPMSCAF